MSVPVHRAFIKPAFQTIRPLNPRQYSSKIAEAGLDKGPKRDPELYVLLGWMASGFALVGWYFGSAPTLSTSQSKVPIAKGAMPWEVDDKEIEGNPCFKYQYHPHGDENMPLKNAPSALNEVVVPNVTLPKSLHDQFNKYGKGGF